MRATPRGVAALVAGAAGLTGLGVGLGVAPAGAGAGPVAGATRTDDALARFHGQRLEWRACRLAPDDDTGGRLDEAGARCADVVVPLDYRRPGGRTITVAVARIEASDTANRVGPLVFNLGGPAIPVLPQLPLAAGAMGVTGTRFDIVAMDPRFSGRSTPIDCGWRTNWLPRSAGASRASFDRTVRLARDLAARCARAEADVLPHATSENMARDLDVVRAALDAPTMSYLGYSNGTYLGALYLQLFPRRAGRIVLDSAVDPAKIGTRLLRDNGPGREAALREWAALAAEHDDVLHLGTTQGAVLAAVDGVYRAAARRPLRVGPYRVDDTVVPTVVSGLLTDDDEDAALELALAVQTLRDAAAGKAVTPDEALDEILSGLLTGDASALHSVQTATMCADGREPRDPEWYWRDIQAHRAGSPLFAPQVRGITPCAFWPRTPTSAPRVRNDVPALVVAAENDVNANLPGARAMHRALTGSRFVLQADVRTHGVYLFLGSDCVDDTVNAYLTSGVLPARDVTCARPADR